MDLFGSGRSTITVNFLFFLIIFPLGIVAEVLDRPNWDKAQWGKELENDRKKHRPDVKGGADGPIPDLIECVFNSKPHDQPFGCSADSQKALLNEILLRKQFKSYNEECNSAGSIKSELVRNPPKPSRNRQGGGLDYPLYSEWQEELINSKLQFCDPQEFLRCSAGRKCVCHLGSIRVGNDCVPSYGSPCIGYSDMYARRVGSGGIEPLYFDPFVASGLESHRTVFIQIRGCPEHTCLGDFRTLYHRDPSYCVDKDIFRSRDPRYPVIEYFEDEKLPLPFNEKCNFQDHNRLFTSTKEEDENYYDRYQTLQDFQTRGVKFCDLEKFLTCGPSEKCECMSPSSRKDDKCILQLDKCSVNAGMEPILRNQTLVPRVREKLMIGFASAVSAKACDEKLTCQTDMTEVYCTCPPGTTGQECEETLTKFLSIVRVPSLPTDVAGYPEKVKVFSYFNNKTLEFEQIFKLGERAVCVWETQNEAEILVVRIRELMYHGISMTKRQYDNLSIKIQNFTTANKNTGGICKESLRCHYSRKRCVRQTRRDYLKVLVKELEKFKTRNCTQPGCSKFKNDFEDVMFGKDETQFYGGHHEMEYHRIVRELSKLLKTCDCPSQSSPHYCNLPNQFILLISIAMFFVVSNY